VIACGQLNDPDRAERLLAEGGTDLVALSRAALADPDWPLKVQRGEPTVPFTPDMLVPNSKISSTRAWRERHAR
jgi:2,4-dienoyl-CoA reductase-like NADH-dependent reductase (Old Yellow Enzyme family)